MRQVPMGRRRRLFTPVPQQQDGQRRTFEGGGEEDAQGCVRAEIKLNSPEVGHRGACTLRRAKWQRPAFMPQPDCSRRVTVTGPEKTLGVNTPPGSDNK
jgi:hypothetical protein